MQKIFWLDDLAWISVDKFSHSVSQLPTMLDLPMPQNQSCLYMSAIYAAARSWTSSTKTTPCGSKLPNTAQPQNSGAVERNEYASRPHQLYEGSGYLLR